MKKYVIASLLCLVLILAVGCTKQMAEEESVVEEPVAEEPVMSEEVSESVAEEAEEVEEETMAAVEGDVKIMGNEGFEPAEFTVKAGETVVFVNEDPKDVVLIFQLKGTSFSQTTGTIKSGETGEHVFEKPGTYEFWSVGHGVKGTVVVE